MKTFTLPQISLIVFLIGFSSMPSKAHTLLIKDPAQMKVEAGLIMSSLAVHIAYLDVKKDAFLSERVEKLEVKLIMYLKKTIPHYLKSDGIQNYVRKKEIPNIIETFINDEEKLQELLWKGLYTFDLINKIHRPFEEFKMPNNEQIAYWKGYIQKDEYFNASEFKNVLEEWE